MDVLDRQIDILGQRANALRQSADDVERDELRRAMLGAAGSAGLLALGTAITPARVFKIKNIIVRLRRLMRTQDMRRDWRELAALLIAIAGATQFVEQFSQASSLDQQIRQLRANARLFRNAANDLEQEVRQLHRTYEESECWRIVREDTPSS